MRAGIIASCRRRGSGGGAFSGLALGLNVNSGFYYNYNTVQNDIFQGYLWEYLDTGGASHVVPAANLDSDGWVTSTPSGNRIKRDLQIPRDKTKSYTISWTNGTGSTTVAAALGTISGATSSSATLTPAYQQSDGLHIEQLTFTFTGTPPKNITVTPVGTSATALDTQFTADTTAQTVSGGPLRVMKMTGVELNDGKSTAFPTASIQTNSINGGSWLPDDGSGGFVALNDGPPIAFLVAMCNTLNRDLWDTYRLNYSNAQVDARATYVRDNLNSNLKYYVEVGNEVWNPSYTNQWGQLAAEATSEGLLRLDNGLSGGGALERSIEKTIQVAQRVKAVWNAGRTGGGTPPTLQRVYNMQNGATANVTNFLNYSTTNTSGSKLSANIEVMSSSLYFGNQLGGPNSSSTDQTALINQGYVEADSVIANAVTTKSLCVGSGISYAGYEVGDAFFINDLTTRSAVQTGTAMYDLYMYFFDQAYASLGTVPLAMFLNVSPDDAISSDWGIKHYTGQSTSGGVTPKYQATIDYLAGKRKLQALSGTLSASVGATAGTVLGSFKRRTVGSTVAINSTSSGAFSFVSLTANVLQVQVADATKFTSAGSISWSITETDARDPAGTRTTSGTCTVAASGSAWNTSTTGTAPSAATYSFTNGNNTATHGSPDADAIARGTRLRTGGNYFEVTINTATFAGSTIVGLDTGATAASDFLGDQTGQIGIQASGGVLKSGSSQTGTWPTFTNGDKIGVYLSSTKKVYFFKNGSVLNGANANTDTGGVDCSAIFGSGAYPAASLKGTGDQATINTGAGTFTMSAPTGATAWG